MSTAKDPTGGNYPLQVDAQGNLLVGFKGKMKPIITVVTAGTDSKTLAELLGKTIDPVTRSITLIPLATGITMASGTATAASHPMGTNPMEIVGDASTLDELEFYAASGKTMTVIQWG